MEIVIKKIHEADYLKLGIHNWPIWEKEVSVFDWSFEEREQFYLIEGEATIKTHSGEYNVYPGDYVECSKGLHCNWEITKYVKKHYHFVEE
jgi:uncharacterized cupin superfamily protein